MDQAILPHPNIDEYPKWRYASDGAFDIVANS